ncbi:uncharacterized protein LOC120163519 [Hibiscus syriacus]|uniref:uncharacterized protein LOC120163519 n=1 Tax=Hibiscus syriacus TaxID=106335 RepID=UPI001921FA3B|nr:uncharacterized protein LOC120163519 [Hibiscus syriacus]
MASQNELSRFLEDILMYTIIDIEDSWKDHLPLVYFSYNSSFQLSIQIAPYEALYGRKCRTPLCCTKLSEDKIVGPTLIRETEEKVWLIQSRIKEASNKYRSYTYLKHKDIEFAVGAKIFHEVSPSKKVLCFSARASWILVSYDLMRRYHSDPSHVIPLEQIEAGSNITYSEELIRILGSKIKELRNKLIHLVKVYGGTMASIKPHEKPRRICSISTLTSFSQVECRYKRDSIETCSSSQANS